METAILFFSIYFQMQEICFLEFSTSQPFF